MYQVTDSSTQHGFKTPFGFKTPHRFPFKNAIYNNLLTLVTQLYPTGYAWGLGENSDLIKLHKGLNVSFLRLIEAGQAMINSTFADNTGFDADDCTLWEYRLGITSATGVSLADRRATILANETFPQNFLYRQGHAYIEYQLRQSGFDVHVYENIFYDIHGNHFYKTPLDILGTQPATVEFGGATQFGNGTEFGGGNFDVIANSMFGESYSTGGNLWPTFFIAGATISLIAQVPKIRESEFRELVLKLKPAHTVAYTFINYT